MNEQVVIMWKIQNQWSQNQLSLKIVGHTAIVARGVFENIVLKYMSSRT